MTAPSQTPKCRTTKNPATKNPVTKNPVTKSRTTKSPTTVTGSEGPRIPEAVRLATVVVPLAGVGALHFPPKTARVVDRLIPDFLPGPKRAWTVGSGVAEVGTAVALLAPKTRGIAAVAAAGLLTALWMGNFKMAWDWRGKSPKKRAIAYGRLPLQIPLIAAAWSLRK